jgi:hypothetical protein
LSLRKKFSLTAGLVVIALFAVSSVAWAAQTTSQIVIGSGSDTTEWMVQSLGDLYSNAPGCNQLKNPQLLNGSCPNSGTENPADFVNYFHDSIVQRYFIGSGGGINQLCQQGLANVAPVDFARSSRVPLPASGGGSDCSGLHFVGFARDGITWECWPGATGNGCDSMAKLSLSVTQLKKIFVSCTVTNWSQVGGSNVAMDPYVAQANSGTGVTWASAMGVQLAAGQALTNCVQNPNNPGQPGSNVSPENTNSLVDGNGDQKNAIFYYSVGVYHKTYGASAFTGSDGSALGKINGLKATTTAISKGTFPVSRFLFNVYCAGDPTNGNKCGNDTASPAYVTNFVGENGFVCKNESDFNDTGGNPILDPLSGKAYRSAQTGSGSTAKPQGEIPNTISAFGFVPLVRQADGTYCKVFTT